MNRQQKRQFVLQAKKRGFTATEAQSLLTHEPNQDRLWEGAKVKLDTLWMRLSPDWYNNKLRKDYKNWVLAHKDDVFTVVFDPKRKEQNANNTSKNDPDFDIMVCLEEDTTEPKWYFFTGDLILQPGGTLKPKNKEELNKTEMDKMIQDIVQEALEREQK